MPRHDAATTNAIRYNRKKHEEHTIREIQRIVGADPDGIVGPATVAAIMDWQEEHGLKPDGKVGAMTLAAMRGSIEPVIISLDERQEDLIIGYTVAHETGGASNPYGACNRNAEFEGWFDKPKRNPEGKRLRPSERAKQPDHKPFWASKYHPDGGTHIGLSYGIIQFTQDGGALGKVLDHMLQNDRRLFEALFGEHALELHAVLTGKKGKRKVRAGLGPGKRSKRVMPIGGHDVWESYWVDKFRRAAEATPMIEAQNRVAAANYLHPAIELCKEFGLTSQVDVAVAFDTSVQYGRKGARKRFVRAHGKHGDDMTIMDVLREFSSKIRGRHRNVVAATDPSIHYDLSNWERP